MTKKDQTKTVIENIQPKHKPGILALLEILNQVDRLAYSLTQEWLDYIIQETSESIFIASHNEKLIGVATCMINQMDKGHALVNIAVHPHYRKQGIGTQLHNQIKVYTKEKQIKTIEAYVKDRLKDSLRFAKAKGFYPVLYAWEMALDLSQVGFETLESKPLDLNFRQASLADSHIYAHIINETFGDALDDHILEPLLEDPSIRVYLLERQGQVIGSTTIQLKSNLSLAYIYDVAILEQARGQGLGTYMLRQSLREPIKDKLATASLTVTGENKKALALYERLGFKQVDLDILMTTRAIKN